jgi:sensor histidine kinase regulating citrate/malate metabolism
MLKNAMEASTADQTVTFSAKGTDGEVELTVHNPACIPDKIQLQLFQRSFSTKGCGHGLGAYSMKLLSERYLNGRVWIFHSSKGKGTTFRAAYPAL